MNVRIIAPAVQHLLDGYSFYERQTAGVGAYFLDTLFTEIDALAHSAGMHPIHFGKYRRFLSRKFPYAVYYCVEQDTVLVLAVLDCRKDPAWIEKQLP